MEGRRLSVHQFLSSKRRVLRFDGPWYGLIGEPEPCGAWIVWGRSGSGKTTFALQLAKYLAGFGKVIYDSLEEGAGRSLQRSFQNVGMGDVRGRLMLYDRVPMGVLSAELSKPRSAQFVIVDSLQYTGLTYIDYKRLRLVHPGKLFVFVSHADGREPAGRTAKSVRYDCDVKVHVHGYRASAVSRFGGGEPYVVWAEGAARMEPLISDEGLVTGDR